jgi:hypothetical protein
MFGPKMDEIIKMQIIAWDSLLKYACRYEISVILVRLRR